MSETEITDITHHCKDLPLAVAFENGEGLSHFKAYQITLGEDLFGAFVTREDIGGSAAPDERWHISISSAERVPTWGEVATIVHDLRPGVPFVMGIPPKSWWINIHKYTLHAFETKDDNLIEQWRFEGRGDRPS